MGLLQVLSFILSMFLYGTFGDSSLIENEASDQKGLLPSTVSGKASNVLRDILNQESLVRFSMVQKIQGLVMDAVDSKKDGQVIKAKLSEVTKELQDLETKSQIIEKENIKLKEELKEVYGTVNDNRNFTKEEIQYLEQRIDKKVLGLQEQLDLSKKTLGSDLKKVLQTLKMTEQNTKEKIKALNESQMVSAKSPQIEMLQYQMNAMNVTLQKCSVSTFFERVKKTEYALENYSVSVNETLHTVCGDVNESSWFLSKVLLKDCREILKTFPSLKGRDGIYRISVGSGIKTVYCDMTTDRGGWTAIQRRQDGSTNFYRTWSEYKQGFGDPSTNYWIGNDAIYELTKNKNQELRIELQSFDGAEAYSQYSTFYVGDKYNKYVLTVSGYSGTAGDSLKYHNGMKFTTKDNDNDKNCATQYHGAWWYKSCHHSNMNGQYAHSAVSGGKYAVWQGWKGSEALKQTMMMIRHKN
ncbi:fibrinogen-like protein 1 [Saccostrea cucullata]|uniref:fibrinogen-like protein 1 n=1 Tax=Saccostrea cuccullata TaxID=36930 RepID=UPI002ED40EE3